MINIKEKAGRNARPVSLHLKSGNSRVVRMTAIFNSVRSARLSYIKKSRRMSAFPATKSSSLQNSKRS